MTQDQEYQVVHRLVKRAVISAASAIGIKRADRQWVAALVSLKGIFERTGWELCIHVATLIFILALNMMFAGFGIREYRLSGWTIGAQFAFVYCVGMSCLLYFLVSRVGLRYIFGDGTMSAYNTWGQLLWSENLTGLKNVGFFTNRGSTSMSLFWPDRKRSLMLFNSLRDAVDAAVEMAPPLPCETEKWCPGSVKESGHERRGS